jgi:hypothetical protein
LISTQSSGSRKEPNDFFTVEPGNFKSLGDISDPKGPFDSREAGADVFGAEVQEDNYKTN